MNGVFDIYRDRQGNAEICKDGTYGTYGMHGLII
jgi:hypothetical protein